MEKRILSHEIFCEMVTNENFQDGRFNLRAIGGNLVNIVKDSAPVQFIGNKIINPLVDTSRQLIDSARERIQPIADRIVSRARTILPPTPSRPATPPTPRQINEIASNPNLTPQQRVQQVLNQTGGTVAIAQNQARQLLYEAPTSATAANQITGNITEDPYRVTVLSPEGPASYNSTRTTEYSSIISYLQNKYRGDSRGWHKAAQESGEQIDPTLLSEAYAYSKDPNNRLI